jgi:PIN domain nuclease of toxin-antitoxin system
MVALARAWSASVRTAWRSHGKTRLTELSPSKQRGRADAGLLDNGYAELPIGSDHAVAVATLPPIHKDPFDRLLVAQAMVEGITLLTADALVAQYPGPVRKV